MDSRKKELKDKVVNLFRETEKKSDAAISVTGNRNIVSGRDTIINTEKIVNKVVAKVEQGDQHITEKQASVLYNLVHEIVNLEKNIKKRPNSYNVVWGSLNKHIGVTQYKLIPYDDFEKAEKYLRKWIGRVNSAASAPKKNPNWRQQRYAHNHTVAKKYNLNDKMRSYMMEKFGVESQKDLDNDELDQLYRRMAAWKRNIK